MWKITMLTVRHPGNKVQVHIAYNLQISLHILNNLQSGEISIDATILAFIIILILQH